jgi:DNA-binding Lrp family transcriptional regulator
VTAQEDCYEVLTKLGLTKLQVRVYLVLNKLGNAPIKTISENTKIDRAHTYQIIAKLQEMGLVQKIIANPNLFRSLPLREGIQILFSRKVAAFREFEENTKDQIKKINRQKVAKVVQNEEPQIVLTESKEANKRIFVKLFRNIKKSYDGIFLCPENFCHYLLNVLDGTDSTTQKLLNRGIKFRLIVCNVGEKKISMRILETVEKLNQEGGFKIRYTQSCTASQFGIIDEKETYMFTGPSSELWDKTSLTSNNPVIVAMAQGYFNQMWQVAQEKKEQKT